MRKRGRHEGSISQRADGRWEARLTLPGGTRKSFYARTRQDVAKRLAAAQADLAKGLPIVAEKQTVEQYLLSWLAGVRSRVDMSTYHRYQTQVLLHLVPVLGKTILARLTAQRIQGFYAQKIEEGLAAVTVRHMHMILHQALKEAVRLEVLPKNPADLVRTPRVERHEMQALSEDQANALLASLEHDRLYALYVLALTTGMRQGELLALKWSAIDWPKRELSVLLAVQETEDSSGRTIYQLGEPKTAASRRKIALSKLALDALQEHRKRQVQEREVLMGVWQDEGRVFPNTLGGLLLPGALYQQFKKHLKRTKQPHLRFHDLRHTAATLALSRGLNVKLVSEMLGHADISITLRIYGHVLPHMHEAIATTMDDIFKRA